MQITHQRGSNTQGSPRRDASATRAFTMIDIILHSRSCEMLSDDSFSSEKIKPSDCSLDIRATNRIGDHGRRRSYLRISLCPDQIFSRPNDPGLCGGRYAGFFAFAETIYGQIAPSRAINGVIRWSTCTIVRTIPGSPFRAVQASRSTRRIIVHYYLQIYVRLPRQVSRNLI